MSLEMSFFIFKRRNPLEPGRPGAGAELREASPAFLNPDDSAFLHNRIFSNPPLPHLLRCYVLTAAFRDDE